MQSSHADLHVETAEDNQKLMLGFQTMQQRSIPYFPPEIDHFPDVVQRAMAYPHRLQRQPDNVNCMHCPVPSHSDKAGFVGDNVFSGPGQCICIVRLDGPEVLIFVQEVSVIAAKTNKVL